ncbi:MAG: tetratricopeptide repeat protein [Chryseobacterium sp.]|nr:MAG: tetratricopeptide repeat protein [Chryseobacterium sp.]
MENTRISKLLKFLEDDKNDPFILYALATEYNNLGDHSKALAYYLVLTNEHRDYVGTYYHLGKLQEVLGNQDAALKAYKDGMTVAREKREQHAFSELQSAYNQAAGLDYEDD